MTRRQLWYGALCVSMVGALAACGGTGSGSSAAKSASTTMAKAAPAAETSAAADANPVTDAARQILARRIGNFTQSAAYMPAGKYGYAPTKGQRTWGQLMAHVAGSNGFFCSKLAGGTAPASVQVKAADGKAKLAAALKASFDYCTTALQGLKDNMLTDSMAFFGGHKVTKAMGLMELVADWADHYAQAAGYLRLNGILPPTARHGGM